MHRAIQLQSPAGDEWICLPSPSIPPSPFHLSCQWPGRKDSSLTWRHVNGKLGKWGGDKVPKIKLLPWICSWCALAPREPEHTAQCHPAFPHFPPFSHPLSTALALSSCCYSLSSQTTVFCTRPCIFPSSKNIEKRVIDFRLCASETMAFSCCT